MCRQRAGRASTAAAGELFIWLCVLLLAPSFPGANAICTKGYLKLDLVSVSGGASCNASPYALCLVSFEIGIASNCSVALTPLLMSGSGLAAPYVPGIWSTNPRSTYQRFASCPTATTDAVDPGSATPTVKQLQAAIQTALKRHVYGASYELGLASSAWDSGTLTLTNATDACTVKYAITQVSPASNSYVEQLGADAVPAKCDVKGALVTEGECQMNLADSCAPGKRPVELPLGGKACALCRAGTYSPTGTGCTACAAGKYVENVGAASCSTQCAAGTYATGGNSVCLPCSPGTYQAAQGRASCSPCPYRSYARLPGATLCVRCIEGVAKCVTASGGNCDANNAEAPSPGYQVLSVTTADALPSATCALAPDLSFANPPLFGQCSLTTPGTTYLSLYVNPYCGVMLLPIKDPACAEPGASYWSSMSISAHYVTPTLIATRFRPSASSPISSYMLTLTPAGASTLTLSYWPATTDTASAALVSSSSKVCSGTVTVVGGQVLGVPTTPASCPAGSYDDSNTVDGCRPCPVGAGCNVGATTPTACAADHFQPYLGQQQSACQVCNASADPRYTSNSGDDYCLVPWVDTVCTNGYEYDASSTTCSMCAAGMYRKVGREDVCTPCPPGYYSPAGATDCVPCPVDQYTPSYGQTERSSGVLKCNWCPVGRVAVTSSSSTGHKGSVNCEACPPGTIAAITPPLLYATCQSCADGYYRAGPAAQNNNVCRAIPAGRKEVSRASATYIRAQVEYCAKGEISRWDSGSRTPADPEACQPCLDDNTYAPRIGMSSCHPCRGGTRSGKSNEALTGNDVCVACTGNTYRPATSTSATCLVCTAGHEVQASGHTECSACLPGYYMPDVNGGTNVSLPAASSACLPCEVNTYQPGSGQASCLQCAAGTSTEDTGSTSCMPCPHGYYSPNSATPCVPAPTGTFVNTAGATRYTACPRGTYNDQEGGDECEPCGAGHYSNIPGSKACRACPAGTYSGSKAPTCKRCTPGMYSPAGAGACIACKPGTFAYTLGASSCLLCPFGRYCFHYATSIPPPCPLGHYNDRQGAQRCQRCPADTYQDTLGQRSCKPCASGFTTRGLTGQSVCQAMRFSPVRRWRIL